MGKGRLEAFSDGVLAIIITVMLLEMKIPHSDDLNSLAPVLPVFLSYILSFIYVGIYWNNHHHMMFTAKHVNGRILWANTHLLFWLSLVPFASGWMGENHFTKWPVIVYGIILMMAGVAYYILLHALIRLHGKNSTLAIAIGKDKKGVISVVILAIGVCMAFFDAMISLILYASVAAIWLIPDKRIEKRIETKENDKQF